MSMLALTTVKAVGDACSVVCDFIECWEYTWVACTSIIHESAID
jgi:hypothetical protein